MRLKCAALLKPAMQAILWIGYCRKASETSQSRALGRRSLHSSSENEVSFAFNT